MTRTRGPTGEDPIRRPRRTGTLSSRLEPDETILVVEDEPDIANFLRAYCRGSAAYLQERLADEVAVGRDGGRPVTLALVRMQPLPDNEVLREVVARLQAALPQGAVLARNAEDELGVILPGAAADAAAPDLER